jgi:hypothetical protein
MHSLSAACALGLATIVATATSMPAGATDPIEVAVHAGLPRIGTLAGTTSAWRNVTVRAQSEDFTLDVVGRTCPDVVVPGAPARTANAADACNDSLAPALRRSLRLAATWKAPTVPITGTLVDVSLRTLRVAAHDENDPRTRLGVDVSIVQPVGPLDLVAGAASPFGAARQPSAFAGLAVPLRDAGEIEVVADVLRLEDGAGLDRSLGVRWRLGGRHGLRLSAGAQRLLDDPHERWRADVGIDWRF